MSRLIVKSRFAPPILSRLRLPKRSELIWLLFFARARNGVSLDYLQFSGKGKLQVSLTIAGINLPAMQCVNPPQIGSPGPGPVRDPLAGAPKTDFWSFRQLVTLCFASYTELSKNIFLKSRFSNLLTFVSRPAAERNIYFFADHRCSFHPDTNNPKPPTMRLGLIFTAAPLFTPRLPPQRRG